MGGWKVGLLRVGLRRHPAGIPVLQICDLALAGKMGFSPLLLRFSAVNRGLLGLRYALREIVGPG